MSELAILTCGSYSNHASVCDVFENLAGTISNLEDRILQLPSDNDQNITTLGPFYGRTLLENVCTALVGRIDPFRLLVVKNVQENAEFGLGSRSNSAIKWFGDIFEAAKSTEPGKMWKTELKYENVSRGLLGDYYGEIFWKSAYKSLLDITVTEDDFLEEYRSQTLPEKITGRFRSSASRLYSSMSKGVHSELVINPDVIYDRTTVLDLLSDTLKLTSILSLTSHLIDVSICRLDIHNAIEAYSIIMERSNHYGE